MPGDRPRHARWPTSTGAVARSARSAPTDLGHPGGRVLRIFDRIFDLAGPQFRVGAMWSQARLLAMRRLTERPICSTHDRDLKLVIGQGPNTSASRLEPARTASCHARAIVGVYDSRMSVMRRSYVRVGGRTQSVSISDAILVVLCQPTPIRV
jgi:hypothetical protein